MTTRHSPTHVLTEQATMIARVLKDAERGDPVPPQFAARIAEARTRPNFKVGVGMDDGMVTLDLLWTVIARLTEAELIDYIVDQMRRTRRHDQPH